MSNNHTKYSYQPLVNRPISCVFCGSTVHGKIQERKDMKTKEIVKECHWVCGRCGNVSRVGKAIG